MKSILEKLREKGDAFFFPRIRAGYKKALDDVEREVKGFITPQKLHSLYLEAVKSLSPKSYNKKAEKPYEKLTSEQKDIDRYIADELRRLIGEEEKDEF